MHSSAAAGRQVFLSRSAGRCCDAIGHGGMSMLIATPLATKVCGLGRPDAADFANRLVVGMFVSGFLSGHRFGVLTCLPL